MIVLIYFVYTRVFAAETPAPPQVAISPSDDAPAPVEVPSAALPEPDSSAQPGPLFVLTKAPYDIPPELLNPPDPDGPAIDPPPPPPGIDFESNSSLMQATPVLRP